RSINTGEHGCKFWWFEYGGRRDTVYETEEIKWELWSVVYGVWDYIKNSGNFPDAENLTLEWVGTIPGKRESRRFEGHYMLRQQDVVEQTHFYDAVSFGGWAIDLHPADGVFSKLPGCNQYHSKGIYEIPYRCFVSKDIKNLFIAGRLISASHVAFGSTRVMATSGHGGQVVGMAAALCLKSGLQPAGYIDSQKIKELQQSLNLMGQSIPRIPIDSAENSAITAKIEASSELVLAQIPFNGQWLALDSSAGQLLPLKKNTAYTFEFLFEAESSTTLEVELQTSSKIQNYTPDILIEKQTIALEKGEHKVTVSFKNTLKEDQYAFIIFRKNPEVKIRCSQQRITGVVSVFNKTNPAVNNFGKQIPPENSGFDTFEFWCPMRRPKGENIAMNITPALDCFSVGNLVNGFTRPYIQPNAWVASIDNDSPILTLSWDSEQTIKSVTLFLDTDYDHPMESSQMGHPEDVMPFVVRDFSVFNEKNELLFDVKNNHQTIIPLNDGVEKNCSKLIFRLKKTVMHVPVSIFQIQINSSIQ
ncbi:MAG TPA: FAD-dependent oxidoreductase, partial [Draconibacterium sp.]|nr:FAD-dependent oxidoreductase [Draconibacterium sp.]